jgi:hypothetical protein
MKLKKRKTPLQNLFSDPLQFLDAQKILSDGKEIETLIEKIIEVYKMCWNRLKHMDHKLSWQLIYSPKVKKRFVNLLFNDP